MVSLEKILSAEYVSDIFSKSKDLKLQYKEYVKTFHPDLHNNKEKYNFAMQKINEFYDRATKLLANGEWEERNILRIKIPNSKTIVAKYSYKKEFELGEMYVCKTKVIYLLKKEFKKFYDNFNVENIFRNLNPELKKNFDIFIPKVKYKFESEKYFVIIFEKDIEYIPLSCLMESYSNNIPHFHVAWIMSRLSNLCCLFKMANVVHCGIDIENIFVSPKSHSIVIFGGWWYTVNQNQKMIGTTQNIFNCMPIYSKSNKIAMEDIDLQSVKMVGRILTKNSNDIPTPFKKWLNGGSCKNSVIEFGKWDKTLEESYGKRKFINCYFDYSNFYIKTT